MRTAVFAAVLATTALIPRAAAHSAHSRATTGSTAPQAAARSSSAGLGTCESGQLCLWAKPDFTGARQTHELSTIDIESCVPLTAGSTAQALVNRTGRPVTTYQSAECAETGEFETYPGGGTWVPQSPYQVRAFKVWEN
ncbi:peptidase inhibitor family I36 protein [Streptomyces sp. NPDC052052]|uniref:peptidase inhibitor family I36 protein n=1 Tax=Streptomyces sp. NPDC052052 TaxID=3154756 RepID=UPI0034474E99